MKQLIITIGILGLLTGCSSELEAINNNLDEKVMASATQEVKKPTCPDSLDGVIYVDHIIEQSIEKDRLKFKTDGAIPFSMKLNEITGKSDLKNRLTGKFSDCDVMADRNVAVQISGICDENILKMTITEKYQSSSAKICEEQMLLSEVPLTHEVDLLIEEGHELKQPYKGEIGTGSYQWRLSLEPPEETPAPTGMIVVPTEN
ncbi:hypothetical protein KAR91_48265 [Candidatus Pacearchaeota archaeon]|nr:hypothetical protein [Candidatus Pacearchaeota archaeon]